MGSSRKVDVAVIGAGTAGLTAYRAARAAGARTVLIEGGPYGTTCARVGCMPSKLLIAAAEAAHAVRRAPAFGVHAGTPRVDGREVMARVKRERDRFVGFVLEGVEAELDALDRYALARHRQDADDRAPLSFETGGHLRGRGRLCVHQFVGQQDGERLVAHDRSGAQDRVSESQRLGLADVDAAAMVRQNGLDHVEQSSLAFELELGFQLIGLVEMVLDGALVSPGNENQVGDARLRRLLDRVLDKRLVDDWKHFLRARLGDREKAAAQPCNRENCLSKLWLHVVHSLFSRSRNLSSSKIATPSACAFSSLLPASLPATT